MEFETVITYDKNNQHLLSPCVPATYPMIYVYFLIKSSMRPVLLLPPLQRT